MTDASAVRDRFHVPSITRTADARWGVFCAACSVADSDYTYPCRRPGSAAYWRKIPPFIPAAPSTTEAAQLAAVRVIIESALVEHEPAAETVTCPTCHDPAPCGTYAFLSAALDAAGRDDGGWVRPPSTPEAAQLAEAETRHAKLRAALSWLRAWPDGVTGKRMVDADDVLAALNADAASPSTPEETP